MILAKAPFRISFVGGGSDLPVFYRRHTGVVVSATIDKAIYIAIHPYFHDKIRIKYSRTEDVSQISEIAHPLVRESLRMLSIGRGMEIASFADVPAGTGMGSSSAFTVCLLQALNALAERSVSAAQLAADACHVEIDCALQPIGKQDQYAAAFGGFNCIRFHRDDSVEVSPLDCPVSMPEELQRRLMLFYTGGDRAASTILAEQSRNMLQDDKFALVTHMAGLAEELRQDLESGQLDSFGEILHAGWLLKSQLARDITNSSIDCHYQLAREAGAEGGKILGAGGGGFLLLYCRPERQAQVRQALSGLPVMPFAFNSEGSRLLYNDGRNAPILAR